MVWFRRLGPGLRLFEVSVENSGRVRADAHPRLGGELLQSAKLSWCVFRRDDLVVSFRCWFLHAVTGVPVVYHNLMKRDSESEVISSPPLSSANTSAPVTPAPETPPPVMSAPVTPPAPVTPVPSTPVPSSAAPTPVASTPAPTTENTNLGSAQPVTVCVRPTAGGQVVCGEVVDVTTDSSS